MRSPSWATFIRGGAESLYSVPSGVAANVISGSQSRPTTCGGVWAWLPRRCAVRPARDVGCPARPFFRPADNPTTQREVDNGQALIGYRRILGVVATMMVSLV